MKSNHCHQRDFASQPNNGKLIHYSHLNILVLLIIFTVTSANHQLVKRMDLDICLGRFDVHTDTIIRTEESRSMGAKFLDDADVSSREQCLRLCCETDGCDVFVFEEKVQGTCFLFQCGPPENFRCKFTKNANYSSAVLGQPQPVAPSVPNSSHALKPPIVPVVLSQHEQELANLRGGKPAGNSVTTTTTVLPHLGDIPATPVAKLPATNHCGRFQFACHSGECIAVYNACDGIPQCEDGSDEGPECPASNKVEPVKTEVVQANPSRLVPPLPGGQFVKQSQPSYQTADMMQQHQLQQQPSMVSAQSGPLGTHNREDPMTAPKQWPHQATNMEPLPDSHIFNHKGGLQIASNGGQQYDMMPPNYNNPQANNLRDTYMPVDTYRNQLFQQQQQWPWPQQKPMASDANGQPVGLSDNMIAVNTNKWPEMETNKATAKEQPTAQEKSGSDDKTGDYYEDEEEVKPTEPPKKKQRKHKKPKTKDGKKTDDSNPHHGQLQLIKNELSMEFPDHDGLAQRPGGAMLSLTLGMIIAAALAILIGCRMRVVGRRIRRHGKGYATDADFLVNGMYL